MTEKENKISRGLGLNTIAINYRNTKEDKYFNKLWEEVEMFAYKMGAKYSNTICRDDMKSLAMTTLLRCCKNIKEDTNFLTYYGRALINDYCEFYNKTKKKNKAVFYNNMLSLDAEFENGNTMINPMVEDDIFFIEDFYEECKLAETEMQFVDLLNIGYKQTEIMDKLQIEKREYSKILKNIRKKVKTNYDFGTI